MDFFLKKLAEFRLLTGLFVCVQTVNSEISSLHNWKMRNVTSSLGKIIPTAIPSLLTAPLCLSQKQYCTKTGLCSSRFPCFDTYLAWLNNQVVTRSTCGAWRTAAASPKCRLARNKGIRSGLICLHCSNKQLEEKMTPVIAERWQARSITGRYMRPAPLPPSDGLQNHYLRDQVGQFFCLILGLAWSEVFWAPPLLKCCSPIWESEVRSYSKQVGAAAQGDVTNLFQ